MTGGRAAVENRPPLGRPAAEWSAILERYLDDHRRRVAAICRLEPALAHLYAMTDNIEHLADVLRHTADVLDPDLFGPIRRRADRAIDVDVFLEGLTS